MPVRHDQKKVRHDQQKAPAALWAGLLAEDEVSALDGAEVSLLQAVGRAIGSPRRREVITAYWKLSAALARLAVVSHEAQRIRRLEATSRLDAGGAASGRLQSAGASAEARRREALLEVQLAQASLSSLLADKPTEWRPGDPPHVGVYRTEFERLFATRPAPARLRLLHRSLPKRHEVILARTNAARASVDVLAVAQNAYRQGRGSAAGVLDRMAALREQRMAFIDAVLAYNLEIAEYALAVANPNAPARLLTPMLIKVGTAPDASRTDPDVARSDSRVPSVAFPPASASTRKPHGGATGQPTPADEPLDAASEKTPLKTTPMDRSALMNPRSPQPRDARRRSANKPVARSPGDDSDSDDSDSADSATEADGYEGLRNLPAAKQTEMLSALLHWDRSSSRATPGRPLTLNDCLARAPVAPRRRVLEAYWAARQQAAFAQVLAEQLEHCKMLVYATLSREEQPQSPTAMLDLQAAKDKVAADLMEARVQSLHRRFELALATGLATEDPWPTPITAPHAGRYARAVDPAASQRVVSSAERRRRVLIAARLAALQARARAVVVADFARSQAARRYGSGGEELQSVLDAMQEQTSQTQSLLRLLTQYNLAIAKDPTRTR